MRRALLSLLLAASLIVGLSPFAHAAGPTATLVKVTDTSAWAEPSPDPDGLTWRPPVSGNPGLGGNLLLTDSEVEEPNEAAIFHGHNAWSVGADGTQLLPGYDFRTRQSATGVVSAFTPEPTGIAVDQTDKWWVVDDDSKKVWKVNLGTDHIYQIGDAVTEQFHANDFGATDPESIEVKPGAGAQPDAVWILDGTLAEVFTVTPGPNGIYNGVPTAANPTGDDVVTSFDTFAYGMRTPEGISYDPESGDLFLVSQSDKLIVEVTQAGALVNTYDISTSGVVAPGDIAIVPDGDANPTTHRAFVVDRALDNDPFPGENDGKMYEFALSTAVATPPATPTGLTIGGDTRGLHLDWADNTELDLAGYNVYRSPDGITYTKLNATPITVSAYDDLAAPAGVASSYQVTAVNTGGLESTPTAPVSATRSKIVFLGSSKRNAKNATSTFLARPTGAADGDLLVASVAVRNVNAAITATGWEILDDRTNGTGVRHFLLVRTATTATSYPVSFSVATAVAGVVAGYRGADTSSLTTLQHAGQNGSTAIITSPSLNSSVANSVLVTLVANGTNASYAPSAGLVEIAEAKNASGKNKVSTEMADDVIEVVGATNARTTQANKLAVNVGQSVLLNPAP